MLNQPLVVQLVQLWLIVAVTGGGFWCLRRFIQRQSASPSGLYILSSIGTSLALGGLFFAIKFLERWHGNVPLNHISTVATLLSVAWFMDTLPLFLFEQLLPDADGNGRFWLCMSMRCVTGVGSVALYVTLVYLFAPATLGMNLFLCLLSVFGAMVASLGMVHSTLSHAPPSLRQSERKILWYIARWRFVNFQVVAMVLYFVVLLFPFLAAPKGMIAENGPFLGMFFSIPFTYAVIWRDSQAKNAWEKLHGEETA